MPPFIENNPASFCGGSKDIWVQQDMYFEQLVNHKTNNWTNCILGTWIRLRVSTKNLVFF